MSTNINRLIESAYRQLGYTKGKYRYKKQTKKPAVIFKSSLAEEAMMDYIKRQPIHGGALRYMYSPEDWTSGIRPLVSRRYYNSAEK
jgi:hypothetical protein